MSRSGPFLCSQKSKKVKVSSSPLTESIKLKESDLTSLPAPPTGADLKILLPWGTYKRVELLRANSQLLQFLSDFYKIKTKTYFLYTGKSKSGIIFDLTPMTRSGTPVVLREGGRDRP